MTTRPPIKGSNSPVDQVAVLLGTTVGVGSPRLHSPTIEEIVTWRRGIETKYYDQLEEILTWDEESTFELSEDVGTRSDAIFHYIAAVLDQRGPSALRKLIDITEPPIHEYETVFAEANRRAFGGRFPQLLLGAEVWLPYKRHLMIEEPNWTGKIERYGSLFQLVDEINSVRAAIAHVRPSFVHASADETSDKVIFAAWQTSNIILRLANIAAAKHLPLWTTG